MLNMSCSVDRLLPDIYLNKTGIACRNMKPSINLLNMISNVSSRIPAHLRFTSENVFGIRVS